MEENIDIILVGDETAASNITFLEIPGLPGGRLGRTNALKSETDQSKLKTRILGYHNL
jgi:hypothetical protein